MATKKAKTLTFRQRLRVDATGELSTLIDAITAASKKIVKDKNISAMDLMKLASSPTAKTLCNDLITQLANGREREIEKFYNKQMDLLAEDSDGE